MLSAAKAVVTKLVIHVLFAAQLSQIGYKFTLVLHLELLNIDIFPIYPYEFMLLQLTINQFMLLPQILYIELNSRKLLKGLKNIAL